MKNTLLVLALITLFSCHRKSEDPKPQEAPKPVPVVVKQKPVWPRLGYTEKNDHGPIQMCGWSVYEKYLRSDTTVSPKVDIYLITKKQVVQGQVISVAYSKEAKIWWAGGEPRSDFMVFRKSKDWNFEQSVGELVNGTSCYMPYSMPQ